MVQAEQAADDFGFTVIADDAIAVVETGEESIENLRVVPPSQLKPELAKAYRELQQAATRLLAGQFKASIAKASDAVNRIAASEDIHGYASY